MRIETTNIREHFQQTLQDFSLLLYPAHPLPNLQCNEPLDTNFDTGFILYEKDKITATACVIKNPDLFYNNEKAVCISHYECIDNAEASKKLLQTMADYCKQQGYKYLIGPLNGSTWNSYRFAVDAITDSYTSEPFHKNYYANHFQNFGFKTAAEYITQIDTSLKIPDVPSILNENIVFRILDKNNYEAEMKKIFAFCKEIFRHNFLYTEITEAAFLSKYNALKNIINPEFVLIAEDKGEIAGIMLALQDYYCQHSKRLIFKTLGRKSGAKYAGVAHELSKRITETALKNNYQSILHAFMHQSNASKNVSRKFSGKPFRTYKLFYKEL